MKINYSIIIPLFNRPQEIKELLDSLLIQTYQKSYEIIIIEDGSINKSDIVIKQYQNKLNINYLFKENSGPGQSRNTGMQIAKGNYYIILDSDVILPKEYLAIIDNTLNKNFTDAFTAPDKVHQSFSNIQKAINYAMTSLLTTGGIRNNNGKNKFQLRSFNMGLSKKAFEKSKGFSKQNFGEDIDLSFRLDNLRLTKQFISKAFIYHKRRTNFKKFFQQTNNFGAARPILNKQHKNSAKITYWFPLLFILSTIASLLLVFVNIKIFTSLIFFYIATIFFNSWYQNKSIIVALLSIIATFTQFFGYGLGFLRSQLYLNILKKNPKETFPKMFS